MLDLTEYIEQNFSGSSLRRIELKFNDHDLWHFTSRLLHLIPTPFLKFMMVGSSLKRWSSSISPAIISYLLLRCSKVLLRTEYTRISFVYCWHKQHSVQPSGLDGVSLSRESVDATYNLKVDFPDILKFKSHNLKNKIKIVLPRWNNCF